MSNKEHVRAGMNRHHPVPRSRGGTDWLWVNVQLHDFYHRMFENKTPQEITDDINAICHLLDRDPRPILEMISEYFWGKQLEMPYGT